MTLRERIESYIGTVDAAEDDAVDVFLQAGAQTLTDMFPFDIATKFAVREAVTDSGIATANLKRPILAEVAGVPAMFIEANESDRTGTSDSLFKRTSLDPVWYIRSGTLYILPAGSSGRYLHAIPYPTVAGADSGVTNMPGQLIQAVVLYAAIQLLAKQIGATKAELTSLAAPSFSFSDITVSTVGGTFNNLDLSTQLTELQTYLNTQEDIELAQAKMNEISVRIAEWRGDLELELQKLIANANLTTDVAKVNALSTLSEQVQEYGAVLQRMSTEIQRLVLKVDVLMKQRIALNDEYTRILTLSGLIGNDTPANG